MADFNKVEMDTAKITEFKTNSDNSFSVVEELLDYTNQMYDAAKAHYDHWVSAKSSYIKKHKETISEDDQKYYKTNSLTGEQTFNSFLFNKDSLAAQSAAETWVDNYMKLYNSNLSDFKKDVETVKNNIEKMKNCAQKLCDAVTEFEAQSITASRLDKARQELIDQRGLANLSGVDYDTEGFENLQYKGGKDGVDAMVTGEDGEKKRAADGIKQGFDFTTTTTSTATAVAALGDRRGWTPEQTRDVQRRQVEYNYRASQRNYEAGYYDTGGDTKTKTREIYESVFNEPYTPSNVQNRLDALRQSSGLTPEEIDFIGAYIGAGTGSGALAPVSSVLLSVDKALDPSYSPFAGDVRGPSSTPSATPSGGCGGRGGGYTPSTPAALVGHTTPAALAGETAVPVATPTAANITRVAEQSIPAPIKTNDARSIDQQASEIFYGKNPDQVAADRANALSIVDKAFSGEGVEDFKEVLKQGGFDDVDINIIMDNKEIAVTAYILATESQSLTGIANQLATANGIVGFDTMYDNGLSRMSLENGLSQSKLMAEVNEEVQDARTNLQNARNKYNGSVKKANESIDEANDKKEKMEEIKKRIIKKSGEDPSKWDDEDIEAYNKAIEEYNEANKVANEAHREALENKELMDQAETDYNETHDRVANEYLKQHQEAQKASQEMAENGETTQELNEHENVEVEKVTNDPNSLSTDDIVTDSEGNVEIQKTEVTTETPAEDTFVSPGEESNVGVGQSSGGGSTENVEVERKLTTDDLMELFNDIEDVANVSSEQRTLDAVDLSSLSSEDRTLPNLGLGSNSTEVANTSSSDNMVSPTEVTNTSSEGNMVSPTDATNELAEERILPGMGIDNSFDNITNVNEVKAIDLPGVEVPDSNHLVGFVDKAANDAQEKTNDFQDNKFNGMGGMSMNMSGLGTETTYSGSSGSTNKTDTKETKNEVEAPKEEKEPKTVAGVQVDASEEERHTDGVLVGEEHPAAEISEDGRSLDFVEIE